MPSYGTGFHYEADVKHEKNDLFVWFVHFVDIFDQTYPGLK